MTLLTGTLLSPRDRGEKSQGGQKAMDLDSHGLGQRQGTCEGWDLMNS